MIQIRNASTTDISRLIELDVEGFSESLPPFVLRMFLDIAGELAIVAESEGKIVGYALGARGPSSDEGWLLSAAVTAEYRAQGLGAELGEELIRRLHATGAKRLLLTTRPDNLPMMKWCKRAGFEQIADDPNYFGPDHRRLVMSKTLP